MSGEISAISGSNTQSISKEELEKKFVGYIAQAAIDGTIQYFANQNSAPKDTKDDDDILKMLDEAMNPKPKEEETKSNENNFFASLASVLLVTIIKEAIKPKTNNEQ